LPAPIDPAKRQAIITDIKAGKPRNQIARDHGVSGSTVTNIAKAEKIPSAFDRAQTQNATRAKRFDAAAARAQLVQDLYADAQRFRARGWASYTQIVSGPAGSELVTTKMPPLRDQQAAYTALAICVDKAVRLEQVDAADGQDGVAAVDQWLRGMLGGDGG
jgi:hypothetical protein